jgi:hypothetical protein
MARLIATVALGTLLTTGCAGSEPEYSLEQTRCCLEARGLEVRVVDARRDGGAINLTVGVGAADVNLAFADSPARAREFASFERSEGRWAETRANVAISSEGGGDRHDAVLRCLER